MKLSTLKRKAAKRMKELGHKVKWGEVFGNAQTQVFSQVGNCIHCGQSAYIHEGLTPANSVVINTSSMCPKR